MAAADALKPDWTKNMYHDRTFGLYIDGKWSWGTGTQKKPVLDPASLNPLPCFGWAAEAIPRA